MNDPPAADHDGRLRGLKEALESWVEYGRTARLERWLDRELDSEGAPLRLSIPDWSNCLSGLVEARRARPGWPEALEARALAVFRAVLRFSRTDGTPATQFNNDRGVGPALDIAALARAFPRTGEARVVGWWLSLSRTTHVPPPLPAWSSQRLPLAALRASWEKQEDALFVDHREGGSRGRLELIGGGRSWLGPEWRHGSFQGEAATPKPSLWVTNSVADLAEWTFRAGGLRVTRSALLLRGRQTALLGEQIESKSTSVEPIEARFDLPPGVTAERLTDCRGLLLRAAGKRATACALPLSLPCLPYETERGSFRTVSDRELSLCFTPRGRRCWIPLLVSWDPARLRKRLSWRILTVSQESKICRPDLALAVRVSWGREDTMVIYRSLGSPAPRAFLGYQTRARFLVGTFTRDGTVEPLVSVE
jgi:hypothetical protein